MKKNLALLILILGIGLTGCTIDISKNNTGSNVSDVEEEKIDEEVKEVKSVGIKSSKDNPLKVGQVGISSKHNAVLDVYQDIDVKLVKIYDNPSEVIDEYNANNPLDKIEIDSNYKLVVLDYEVTLVNFETESFGTDVLLDVEVMNESDSNFVVDGIKEIIEVYSLKVDTGVVSGESGTVTIAFGIPKDVTNYLVKLGTNNHTIAYYKI